MLLAIRSSNFPNTRNVPVRNLFHRGWTFRCIRILDSFKADYPDNTKRVSWAESTGIAVPDQTRSWISRSIPVFVAPSSSIPKNGVTSPNITLIGPSSFNNLHRPPAVIGDVRSCPWIENTTMAAGCWRNIYSVTYARHFNSARPMISWDARGGYPSSPPSHRTS